MPNIQEEDSQRLFYNIHLQIYFRLAHVLAITHTSTDCYYRMDRVGGLEDRDVTVDLGSVSLRHAFGDPDDVTALLLLQLHVRVEDSKVELVKKSLLH